MIEYILLQSLEWLGKVIGAKLAGTAAGYAWQRLFPYFETILKSSGLWKETAQEHKEAVDNAEAATQKLIFALDEANANIKALQDENGDLRKRLSKYEPMNPPPL